MRIGNGAFNQHQNDVFGAVLDSVYLHTKMGGHIPQRLWPVIEDQVQCALAVWEHPDQGIWEARGEPKHYVSSKLMCWVAADRGARLAELEGEAGAGRRVAGRRRPRSAKTSWPTESRDRGVFRQHYETDALDASTLLIPLVRFLPADDERVRATVLAIADELTENGFVLRYRVDETDDGLHGEEGTFLICSFWLVSALSEIGEKERADGPVRAAAHPRLTAGAVRRGARRASGRHLGNYPQAFTHLALINAVMHVIQPRRPGTEQRLGPAAVSGSKLAAQQLAGGVAREDLDELDLLGQLVAAQVGARLQDLVAANVLPGLEHDRGMHRLPPELVRDAEHADLAHRRMAHDRLLDLARIDVHAAAR